ncbi:hypothetical protein CY34DRAFT_804882 [Suillus luteus UH-Slu-Lm8-n1]|uniref:Uncharacterized protein n=1 Tax=Suillus luteus UH-Slu-Lm8-n1 TaxID=930992 RepID=A0A0D0B7T4_9AGAM|nr:hypothetical protein CY34DRAFT_804882 [Suillus luteus UH-Slu-Lm8-n1]
MGYAEPSALVDGSLQRHALGPAHSVHAYWHMMHVMRPSALCSGDFTCSIWSWLVRRNLLPRAYSADFGTVSSPVCTPNLDINFKVVHGPGMMPHRRKT